MKPSKVSFMEKLNLNYVFFALTTEEAEKRENKLRMDGQGIRK